ncbi:4-diphosphocytidyl-2C-methyl-D-erythritol synthase [Streptomyces spiroverticillatus]|uniref:4-diphosphocytidyl-2C-methyl-D-erythritol synthase n=1 Tax=Streptomyces finlayi TaxID=67296 RepID=A0A918WV18_9ACTN|nr:nucleotidyltransferase family protein [Streptomyces finlayi]GHA01656.1 4-diphosphocytidyl-2C-methyl-D-erythritol synthase [Streptomyces spiroverticillatus]GHC86012.1 4-diphosphocytidyl-2C-methyl-D-erythritol synthase [Streptomyces finlayi]
MTHPTPHPPVAGLLLAAGGGRRLGGRPKALLDFRGRPLVEHAVRVLREGGCSQVYVVLGAAADEVRRRAGLAGCVLVENPEWEQGMGSSLRAGLRRLSEDKGYGAALTSLVDQPGIGPAAVARVLGAGRATGLAAASYDGERGHPVLFGADRWADIARTATGDRGARAYLEAHAAELTLVECGDVAQAYDIDLPEDLARLEV